jgi:hypothetical protein
MEKYMWSFIKEIKWLGFALSVGLAVTTVYMTYSLSASLIRGTQYFPGWLESIAIVAVALAMAAMIDNALFKQGVSTVAAIASAKQLSVGSIIMLAFFVINFGIRLGFSGTSTWLAGVSISRESTAPPDSDKGAAIAKLKQSAINDVRKGEQAALAALNTERSRADRLVAAAIESGNADQRKWYAEGNAWFLATPEGKAYNKKIEAAKKQAAKIEAEASAAYQKRVAGIEASVKAIEADQAYTTSLRLLETEATNYETVVWLKTAWWSALDFVLIAGFLGCCIILGTFLPSKGYDIDYFFPSTPSIMDVAGQAIGSTYDMAVAYMAGGVAVVRAKGSRKMAVTAKSITTSTKDWNDSVKKYHDAMAPSTATPQHFPAPAATPQQSAATLPQHTATPTRNTPPDSERGQQQGGGVSGYYQRPAQAESPAVAAIPEELRKYAPPPLLQGESGNATPQHFPAPAATPQHRNTATVAQHRNTSATPERNTDPGALYRSHMSYAKKYIGEGKIQAAIDRLAKAKEAAVNADQKARAETILETLKNAAQ